MEAQDKKDKTMLGYRIVEIKNGKVYSLFHGTRGSREIKLDTWNRCDKKPVRDGKGFTYISGWHFLQSEDYCKKFFESMFRVKTNRYVIPCYARGDIRHKHPEGSRGKPCLLADEILIRGEDVCFS